MIHKIYNVLMLLVLAATTAGAYAQEGARNITLQQAREMAL